jgi:hypothetical protein
VQVEGALMLSVGDRVTQIVCGPIAVRSSSVADAFSGAL